MEASRLNLRSLGVLCFMACVSSFPSWAHAQATPPLRPESAPLETTIFPNKDEFIRSFAERAEPICFNAGIPFSFPGGSAFVPAESPYDDIVCDERGTLRTIFGGGRSGRVEVVTIPNVDPLINHLRFLGGLALIGDCPESAPRWPGCFPLPELGSRAPVNLPPGAFFQPLPPAQDRMTVDRFLNMCRLHELIMPEPIAGNPQSLVDARFQFLQFFGLQTTVGPEEQLLRRQFSGAPPTCGGDLPGALVLRELLDLGLPEENATAVAEEAAERGARTEEVIEDLVRACDGKPDAARCFPETTSGQPFGLSGSCSTPMLSIGACTAGDPSCGERRVCLPGMQLATGARCGLDPTLSECSVLDGLERRGVPRGLAEAITSGSTENGSALMELLDAVGDAIGTSLTRGLLREFSAGCVGATQGDICVAVASPGTCSRGSAGDDLWCIPTGLILDRANDALLDDFSRDEPPVCAVAGQDLNGDGACDLCEQIIGLNGLDMPLSDLGPGQLAFTTVRDAALREIQLTDDRMVRELDRSAQMAVDKPLTDEEKIRGRNERRVVLFNDRSVRESDCGDPAKCDFSFRSQPRASAGAADRIIPSDAIAYGHVHTITPISEQNPREKARRVTRQNRLPSSSDGRVFDGDPERPRRPFYTRGTDGRVTKFTMANRSCLGEFFLGAGFVEPVRDPDPSKPLP